MEIINERSLIVLTNFLTVKPSNSLTSLTILTSKKYANQNHHPTSF
jgi:hypothetical protein